jgi:hypothetical protein
LLVARGAREVKKVWVLGVLWKARMGKVVEHFVKRGSVRATLAVP